GAAGRQGQAHARTLHTTGPAADGEKLATWAAQGHHWQWGKGEARPITTHVPGSAKQRLLGHIRDADVLLVPGEARQLFGQPPQRAARHLRKSTVHQHVADERTRDVAPKDAGGERQFMIWPHRSIGVVDQAQRGDAAQQGWCGKAARMRCERAGVTSAQMANDHQCFPRDIPGRRRKEQRNGGISAKHHIPALSLNEWIDSRKLWSLWLYLSSTRDTSSQWF